MTSQSEPFDLSHRQLISLILSLLDSSSPAPLLAELGYSLHSLELPMVDRYGHRYTVDVFALQSDMPGGLLIEGKTHESSVKVEQVRSYLNTTPQEVISLSAVGVQAVDEFVTGSLFVVLPNVQDALLETLTQAGDSHGGTYGIIIVDATSLHCAYGTLSGLERVEKTLEIPIATLPLETIPFEPDCPRHELADIMFQTLYAMFQQGVRTFTVAELCELSNDWWPYLASQHARIKQRMKQELRRAIKVALHPWLEELRSETNEVVAWQFKRRASGNRRSVQSFRRVHARYVQVSKHNRLPERQDFLDFAMDQLILHDVAGLPVDFSQKREP